MVELGRRGEHAAAGRQVGRQAGRQAEAGRKAGRQAAGCGTGGSPTAGLPARRHQRLGVRAEQHAPHRIGVPQQRGHRPLRHAHIPHLRGMDGEVQGCAGGWVWSEGVCVYASVRDCLCLGAGGRAGQQWWSGSHGPAIPQPAAHPCHRPPAAAYPCRGPPAAAHPCRSRSCGPPRPLPQPPPQRPCAHPYRLVHAARGDDAVVIFAPVCRQHLVRVRRQAQRGARLPQVPHLVARGRDGRGGGGGRDGVREG